MTKYSGDIRTHIRDTIGYAWEVDGVDVSTVSVTDDYKDTVYVPLYLPGDVRVGDLPEMPFIEMTMVNIPTKSVGINGDVVYQEIYFDMNIYYVSQDGISATTFGRTVADKTVQLIDTYNKSVTSAYYVDVINSGREIIEEVGGSVIFHRVVECYANNYQK
jgi:hypothetical protein